MIRRGEFAARAQRDAQGGEVARADLVVPRVPVHAGPGRKPLHVDAETPVGPGQERDHRAGNACDAGERPYLVFHAVVEQERASAVVAAPFGREAERDHAVDPHPQIHPSHVDQALHE